MNWEAIVAIVELVGLFAIIASLVYVAVQVKQNTELFSQNIVIARSAMVHDTSLTYSRFFELIAENPDLASIYRRGIKSEELDPDEVIRFESLLEVYFVYLEDADHQFQSGLYFEEEGLDDPIETMAPQFRDMLSCKYGYEWWERTAEAANVPGFYRKIQRIRSTWDAES